MAEQTIQAFLKGTHNKYDDEIIPQDSASDSKNFITKDGAIQLAYGKKLVGAEGLVGAIRGLHFGFKTDGTPVLYRKIEVKIQYWDGAAWQDVTGLTTLTANAEYSFSNYSSLAGAFTFISGIDGFYKINNANPGSSISLYDATKNDKGKILIDKGRLIMWDCADVSKSTLKLSHIDTFAYTTIEQEFLGANGAQVYNGTLAFKAGDAMRNCFGVLIAGGKTTPLNIISLSQAADAIIGIEIDDAGLDVWGLTWLGAGDKITLHGIGGMVEMNDLIGTIVSVSGSAVTIDIDSTAFTPYAGPNAGEIAEAELLVDDKNGALASDDGGTGTINYTSGVYATDFVVNTTLTPVTAYQYENSNNGGLSDFTYTAVRVAGEGWVITQDVGGDDILNVLIGQDGKYYSLKQQSCYQLDITAGIAADFDLVFTNLVYRQNLGIPYWRAAVSTSKGIVFMNTADPDDLQMTILQRNPLGDNIEPVDLFPHFDFSKYDYSECAITTWGRYILVACMEHGSTTNDVLLLCDMAQNSVDMTNYAAKCFNECICFGDLYVGSPITQSVYQVFNGFDDDGLGLTNFWTSKGEKYYKEEVLKKFRKLIFKGDISKLQEVSVYIDYDDAGFQLVGKIDGSESYVDLGSPRTIGGNMIGTYEIGLGAGSTIYPYMCELKVPRTKFRKRKVKFVANEIGYFSLKRLTDWDILTMEGRIPKRFRTKQT